MNFKDDFIAAGVGFVIDKIYKWYLWGSFTEIFGIVGCWWFWLAAAAAAAKCNHKEDCKPPAPASVAEVVEVVDEEGGAPKW